MVFHGGRLSDPRIEERGTKQAVSMPVSSRLSLGLSPPSRAACLPETQSFGPAPGKGAPVCQGEGREWVTRETGLQGRCGQMTPVS